ncbi:acyltransferase family protein, partial [Bradyrhizobium sp.]|uniref:acyltransferase family protein n=1 Tax=Bradyrhizobium sp. TaxID=376 RepID=UPI003C3A9B36
MRRFAAIEGLRGWLAWAVVLGHLSELSNIGLGMNGELGYRAVETFIIISGFIITNLIIGKPEPYRIYLLRRFMRIFPLFAVTCIAGYFADDVLAWTCARVSYAGDPAFTMGRLCTAIARSNHEHFWAHAVLHLTMLHGAMSSSIVPLSQYAFDSPSWSLSLEWQFYLVAPLIVMLVAPARGYALLALFAGVMLFPWYRSHLFGDFVSPSFLPDAADYFAIGIASRLALPRLASRTLGIAALIVAALIVLCSLNLFAARAEFAFELMPWAIWAAVLSRIVATDDRPALLRRWYDVMLEGNIATYFGSRSYSVYLCHLPLIAVCHVLLYSLVPEAGSLQTFVLLTAISVPAILVAAELLYRGVERPG